MKLKPVSNLNVATKGELLAMCKLVQMVANHGQFNKIDIDIWKWYVSTSLGVTLEEAEILVQNSRRFANRILTDAAE